MKKIVFSITTLLIIASSGYYLTRSTDTFLEPVVLDSVVYGISSEPPTIGYQEIDVDNLGAAAFRPSEYKTTLGEAKTEGHADTTMIVSSITTKDGNTLNSDTLGDRIVLHIAPGRSNAEIVVCTGLTVSTKTFTSCTFGYRFDTNATQAANIKAHSPGETVIISDDDHYLTVQYPTLDAANTFTNANYYASSTASTVKFYLTTSTSIYLWANKDNGNFGFATSGAGELTWNTNGTTFIVERPLLLSAGVISIATNTFDFTMNTTDNLFRIATGTISGGTASGNRLDDYWNLRFNATTTLFSGKASTTDYFVIGNNATSSTGSIYPIWPYGSEGLFVSGNATTTGSQTVGNLCFDSSAGGTTVDCVENVGWEQLGETVLTANGATIAVSSLPTRKELMIKIYIAGWTADGIMGFTVNGDTAANYGYVRYIDDATRTSVSATSGINPFSDETSVANQYYTIHVINRTAEKKLFTITGTGADTTGTNAPSHISASAVWNNTAAQISSMTVTTSASFLTGSRLTIYGSKD